MKKDLLNFVLSIVAVTVLGVAVIVFTVLYLDLVNISFLQNNKIFIEWLLAIIISIFVIFAIIMEINKKDFIFKLTLISLIFIVLVLIVLYVLSVTGFWDKIDSIEDLRNFVASYGKFTVPLFIVLQFLQVVILPIPGFIAVGAGVALFGPFYACIYSSIGIILGSFVGFIVGRKLGYKVACWLCGKESLDKGLELVKGRDIVILTFMFFFPFFPDDVLCFVAGLSTMSSTYFAIMIVLTRLFSIITTCYSLNGSLIPYNTWWGISLWGIVLALTVFLTIVIYKKGDKIEKFFKKKFRKKKK